MPSPLAQALLAYTDRQPGESPFRTPIDGLGILRSDHPKPPRHLLQRPSLCIVAQGAKWGTFGDTKLEYKAGEALLIGVETPSVGQVFQASPDAPCLVLVFELDLAALRSVAETLPAPPRPAGQPGRGVFVTDFKGPLEDCALRLVRLLDTPEAIPTLHPIIMREISYWLLTGPHGADVARMALAGSPSQRVMSALTALRARFREPLRMEDLAHIAAMSPSAFHREFKALTAQTPLQYQKQLRLLEARRLMLTAAANVETAAFTVGYESPSQFSREYARMFGAPPKRDVGQLREVMGAEAEEGEVLAA
ncbi:MAG: AraC family transcriptional regulator [Caulobacteraceae bacterium]